MISQMAEILADYYVESRKHRRYTIDEPGSVCGVATGVRNISRGGAQVACAPAALEAIGDKLHSVSVPFVLLVEPALTLSARVVYQNQEDGVHLIGLQFVDMTPPQEAAIERYVSSLA